MLNKLSALRVKELRERVLARQKSPTAKINRVLRRKAMFAKMQPSKIAKHSHELIFAQDREKLRTREGEVKRRKLKLKYGVAQGSTHTNVGILPKFISTRRTIHTHPLIILKGRAKQLPFPSLADLVILLSFEERSSLIAVPSKRGSREVAGYMVVKKTSKSSPLSSVIREKQKQFMGEAIQNSGNTQYWTRLLNLLNEEKYSLIKEDTQLVKAFEVIKNKSNELAQINSTHSSKVQGLSQNAKTLRTMYEQGQFDQITYSKRVAQVQNEIKQAEQNAIEERVHLERQISELLAGERFEMAMLQTFQLLLDKGFVDEFRKNLTKKTPMEPVGFQRVRPTQPTNINLVNLQNERKKLVEEKLGLHLRLVPTKGFELRNGQFVKQRKRA